MSVLEHDLRHVGYKKSLAEFKETLKIEYTRFIRGHSPAMKPEEFILRPALAMEFVDRFRDTHHLHGLRDHMILGALVNGKHKGVCDGLERDV